MAVSLELLNSLNITSDAHLNAKFSQPNDAARDALITNTQIKIGFTFYHEADNKLYYLKTYPTPGSLTGVVWQELGDGAVLSSHVSNTNNPHSTTLDQVLEAGNTSARDITVNSLTANGNVFINGSTIQVDSEITTTDAVLVMNDGEVGIGVTNGFAGFEIDRGTSDSFWFGFDEVRNRFTVGTITGQSAAQIATTQVLATRADSLTNNAILKWDATANQLVDSGHLDTELDNLAYTNVDNNSSVLQTFQAGINSFADISIINSSGANLFLNSNTSASENGIYMTESASGSKTTNGARVYYDGADNEFRIAIGNATLTDYFKMARDTGISSFEALVNFNAGVDIDGNDLRILNSNLIRMYSDGGTTQTFAINATASGTDMGSLVGALPWRFDGRSGGVSYFTGILEARGGIDSQAGAYISDTDAAVITTNTTTTQNQFNIQLSGIDTFGLVTRSTDFYIYDWVGASTRFLVNTVANGGSIEANGIFNANAGISVLGASSPTITIQETGQEQYKIIAGASGLFFKNDGDNQFFLEQGGDAGFYKTDGSVGLYFESFTGNVGIGTGTATPSYKLDVNGTGRFVGLLNAEAGAIVGNDSSSNLLQIRKNATGDFIQLYRQGTEVGTVWASSAGMALDSPTGEISINTFTRTSDFTVFTANTTAINVDGTNNTMTFNVPTTVTALVTANAGANITGTLNVIGSVDISSNAFVDGNLTIGNNTNSHINFDTTTNWNYYLKSSGNDWLIEDGDATEFIRLKYNSGGATKSIVYGVNLDATDRTVTAQKFLTATASDELADFQSTDLDAYIRIRDNQDSFYVGTKNGIGYIGGLPGAVAPSLLIDLVNGDTTFAGDSHWLDQKYLFLGTDDDLKVGHNGTNNYIESINGDLYIQATANGNDIFFQTELTAGTRYNVLNLYGGSASYAELLYNGSKKFETSAGGADITGNLDVTNFGTFGDGINIGSLSELQIGNNGTISYIDALTDDLYIRTRSSGNDIIFQAENTLGVLYNALEIKGDSDVFVRLMFNGGTKATTTNDGLTISGQLNTTDNINLTKASDGIIGSSYTGGANVRMISQVTSSFIGTGTAHDLNIGREGVSKILVQSSLVDFSVNVRSDRYEVASATHYIYTDTGNMRFETGGNFVFNQDIEAKAKIIASDTVRLASYTVATLPTGTEGDMAYVTDATSLSWRGTATGGGSSKALVFYDGTNWLYH